VQTIRQLAAQLQAGTLTSAGLVDDALARIEAHRREGGAAYVSVDAQAARAAALASDEARARGRVPSLLAGLPVSVKDLFDVTGEVTSAGSRVLADRPAAVANALAVSRLRAAGAILLGRTNMSEFGYSGLGLNPHYGTPLNPVDECRVAGGSTSGGAVSVALDMAVAALGTDTGGSVRIPAAFCGLTGFKPTQRRVPMTGTVPGSVSLDSAGPLARSVDCCAIVDAILAGEEPGNGAIALSGLTLGLCTDHVGEGLDAEVARAFERAVSALSSAGVVMTEFAFPELRELAEINRAGGFAAAESARWHRGLIEQREAEYDRRVSMRIRRGEAIDDAAMRKLEAERARLQAVARSRLGGFDAWVMPTVALVAPALAPLDRDDETFFAVNALTVRNPSIINFLDGCALTLPCAEPGALPVGISICGLAGADGEVLGIGRSVERLFAESWR